MALRVIWSKTAQRRLIELTEYIAQRDASAADKLWYRIESATIALAEHPYIYRSGRMAGTREMVVHPNYIVIYRVMDDVVRIVTVLHAHQHYP